VKLENIGAALDAFHHSLDLATLLGLYVWLLNVAYAKTYRHTLQH